MEILFAEFPVPRIPYDFINDGEHFVVLFPNGAISGASGHFHSDPENPRIDFISHPSLAFEWSRGYYAKRGISVRVTKNEALNVYRAVAEEWGHYLVFLRDGPSTERDNAYWEQILSKPSISTHDLATEEQEVQSFSQSYEPFLREMLQKKEKEGINNAGKSSPKEENDTISS
jgi:hypothetical protein